MNAKRLLWILVLMTLTCVFSQTGCSAGEKGISENEAKKQIVKYIREVDPIREVTELSFLVTKERETNKELISLSHRYYSKKELDQDRVLGPDGNWYYQRFLNEENDYLKLLKADLITSYYPDGKTIEARGPIHSVYYIFYISPEFYKYSAIKTKVDALRIYYLELARFDSIEEISITAPVEFMGYKVCEAICKVKLKTNPFGKAYLGKDYLIWDNCKYTFVLYNDGKWKLDP